MTVTRRTLMLGSAAGAFGGPPPAEAADPYPPPFSTHHAQFTVLDPREEAGHIPLRDLEGRRRTLAAYRGKAVLLAFWASWCPPCRRELPILHRLQNQAKSEPFVVVPVSLDRDAGTAAAYLRRLRLDGLLSFIDTEGEVASGPKSKVAPPFPLYGMPMSYVIDASGRSGGYLTGEADWSAPDALALLHFYARA
ncbi:TlpA disulfide reductase family protein [Bosea sp. RAC05]|uniref:TlpA disulfide reductase family protein n=1 Tax=Bosea sp. RAC05 TaxID=1842539 RepID=UPI00083D2B12|nr:TlpA disulfide reductase family protein [Bosea sp. RAC05]AOG07134.1 thioredoxin family protein [Bosea sp. RAC05]